MNGIKLENHSSFEYQENGSYVMIAKIDDDFNNDSEFTDFVLKEVFLPRRTCILIAIWHSLFTHLSKALMKTNFIKLITRRTAVCFTLQCLKI